MLTLDLFRETQFKSLNVRSSIYLFLLRFLQQVFKRPFRIVFTVVGGVVVHGKRHSYQETSNSGFQCFYSKMTATVRVKVKDKTNCSNVRYQVLL